MALHRPRRIFRAGSSLPRHSAGGRDVRRTVLAGLLASTVAGAALLLVLPAELFGRVPAMTGMAAAAQAAVVDGQTLRLNDTVVRLQGVSAPARGVTCLAPDNSRFDCGAAASAALAQLVRGRAVNCRLYGRDAAGFVQGLCDAAGRDINRALVATGWARARSDNPGFSAASFSDEEAQARAAQRGLWRGGEASF